MKALTSAQVVDMFMEAGESYGFRSVFEGTFGGILLHDEETNQFIWLTEDEHEELQEEADTPIFHIARTRIAANTHTNELQLR